MCEKLVRVIEPTSFVSQVMRGAALFAKYLPPSDRFHEWITKRPTRLPVGAVKRRESHRRCRHCRWRTGTAVWLLRKRLRGFHSKSLR